MVALSVIASPPSTITGPVANLSTYAVNIVGTNIRTIAAIPSIFYGQQGVASSYKLAGTTAPTTFIPKHLQLTASGWKPVS